MNDILWLTMRRMRAPLIILILVYAISVFGMVLVPGSDEAGQPYHLSFLEAGYFVAILATTIGFGEIPYQFNDAQRLWTFLIVFPNVTAWLYSIGAILGLFLDSQFQAVLKRARFSRRVRWLGDPFFIVCGFGNTGSLVVEGLSQRGLDAVVLDIDDKQIQRLLLNSDYSHTPALTADASQRDILESSGLQHPQCHGVITTCNDDHANLTIAITCKLLRPDLQVLARSESAGVSANMASFGTDFIIDPYEIFADRLTLALRSPAKYLVQDWLISVPGSALRTPLTPPLGNWIVCGLGQFGRKTVNRLAKADIPFTVVEQKHGRLEPYPKAVLGRGTEADTLEEAGIHQAAAIIAGTGDDVDNLSIILTARELNPDIFVVARQENQDNQLLFDASAADLVARRSLIAARRILALVTTPLLSPFLDHLIRAEEAWADKVRQRLEKLLQGKAPDLWTVKLEDDLAQGLEVCEQFQAPVHVTDLSEYPRQNQNQTLNSLCLVLERGGQRLFLPSRREQLRIGDHLLFAGRGKARREMLWLLSDPNRLLNRSTGVDLPRGAIWRWLYGRRKPD